MIVEADRVSATYLIETAFPLAEAADAMAGEQSTGTFVRLRGETDELRNAHGARVERVLERETVKEPSLPDAKTPKGVNKPIWRRGEVELSWPISNFGTSLPNLLATVAGNLFELGHFSGMRLLDLHFPEPFATACAGPAFAVAGTRRLTGVTQGPIIGTIIKPSVGLSPAATADLVRQLCEADIDFIKDDELQANGPHCPLAERVGAVMAVIDDHAQRSGKKIMYAFNVTDDHDEMLRHHDMVATAGGTCVMVSLNAVGLTGLSALRRRSSLPIHGHRNGWGYLSRAPMLGFSYVAWQKIWRLAGVDHMHVNGIRNKFCEPDRSVILSARTCLTPLFPPPHRGFEVMPVFSSGQWAGQAIDTFAALGSTDVIYCCGGGIMAHPRGIAAGVQSIREGWESAQRGVDLTAYAATHSALAEAIATFS